VLSSVKLVTEDCAGSSVEDVVALSEESLMPMALTDVGASDASELAVDESAVSVVSVVLADDGDTDSLCVASVKGCAVTSATL
jgi:hypothetical protein